VAGRDHELGGAGEAGGDVGESGHGDIVARMARSGMRDDAWMSLRLGRPAAPHGEVVSSGFGD
jgi:hypothetical protein